MKKRFLQIADWRKVLLLGMAFFYGNVAISSTLTTAHAAGDLMRSTYQLITIKGKVTDEQGMPIPGTTVRHKETGATTATNADGDYHMNVPQNSGTLVFSVVGYQIKEVALKSNTIINISMEAVAGNLNEIVVVGYGTQKKATVTGSVVSVKGSEIVKSPSINVANSLAGRLPGVIINNRAGEPGRDNPSISIRGRSTTGNSSVLLLLIGWSGVVWDKSTRMILKVFQCLKMRQRQSTARAQLTELYW
ncbi:carboxypeptidase-like regulatory domain-containing protein [Pedobacter sp. N36a]|uniref:carboxypeptidase-like regulatory domain-containing protein n=1 Tax=Pedobacter sp. N36a TaxID=2767996 RepID=UPI001656D9E7|nr:carboxypeptidase-like regulatory domain-containing protein [Pedobacter sp. N36a]MBC8984592.1 carboxypeptidase-like regulatory domain-containing protein [Pedobacter sp. N36a]